MSKQPPPDPWVNFYHSSSNEVKRLNSKAEDFGVNESRLKQQGWSRERFAQTVYHKKYGAKTVRTRDDLAAALKQGWRETPIDNAKDAEGAHPDAVHPHHADKHRVDYLDKQASAK